MNNKRYWLFSPGEQAFAWNEQNEKGFMGLAWDELDDLTKYKTKEEIYDALVENYGGDGSKKNDITANWEFVNTMQIGDIVLVKKGRTKLLGYGIVDSDYYFDEERNEFKHCRRVDWKLKGNWEVNQSLVLKTLTDITQYSTDEKNYDKFHQFLMSIMLEDKNYEQTVKTNKPLNQILYGPPGTGKTYKTKQLAVEIITGGKIEDRTALTEKYNELKDAQQIVFTTFHQSMSYEDFVEGIKPVKPEDNDKFLKYKIEKGVFKTICEIASLKEQLNVEIDNDNQELTEELFKEYYYNFADQLPSLNQNENWLELETYGDKSRFKLFQNSNGSISVRAGLEKFPMSLSLNDLSQFLFHKEKPTFKSYAQPTIDKILEESKLKKEEIDNSRKNYVLIIDEINRANVSAVFGELITLLEPDKRLGEAEAITLKLPYSKTDFGVPSNLYIIGTMNTADRSVEALDTALRRRFSFEEVMPKYDLDVIGAVYDIPLSTVLETINNRIEVLIDSDHTIGHSYFIGIHSPEELLTAFNDKIIPLLQEYFYGDYGKIGLVLGEGFVEEVKKKKNLFTAFKYEGKDDLNASFYKLKTLKVDELKNAIELLLNQEKTQGE